MLKLMYYLTFYLYKLNWTFPCLKQPEVDFCTSIRFGERDQTSHFFADLWQSCVCGCVCVSVCVCTVGMCIICISWGSEIMCIQIKMEISIKIVLLFLFLLHTFKFMILKCSSVRKGSFIYIVHFTHRATQCALHKNKILNTGNIKTYN